MNKAFAARVGACGNHGLRFLAIAGFRGDGRAEYLPEGKDPRDFLVCQCAVDEDFDAVCVPRLTVAKLELTKVLEDPCWSCE